MTWPIAALGAFLLVGALVNDPDMPVPQMRVPMAGIGTLLITVALACDLIAGNRGHDD